MQDPRPDRPSQHYPAKIFDRLERIWNRESTRRAISRSLVFAFLGSLLLIELARLEIQPTVLGFPMPTNHLHAISWVMTLLLVVEILDLVFGLADSVANSLGKQLEIVSLVLLRKTFDELPSFPEPIAVEGHLDAVLLMAAQAGGALAMFLILLVFYRVQRHESTFRDAGALAAFVGFKKLVSLLLLIAFVVVGIVAGVDSLTLEAGQGRLSLRFFEVFFTLLIFADILIALASIGSGQGYRVVFRNFGFALVTVTLRLALAAEPYGNALLGIGAAAFAVAVSWAFRMSGRTLPDSEEVA